MSMTSGHSVATEFTTSERNRNANKENTNTTCVTNNSPITPTTSASKKTSPNNMTMTCMPPPAVDSAVPIPRRNLSEAFEELYDSTPAADAPADDNDDDDGKTAPPKDKNEPTKESATTLNKQQLTSMISPTGVDELHAHSVNCSNDNAKSTTTGGSRKVNSKPVPLAEPSSSLPSSSSSTVSSASNAATEATTFPYFHLHESLKRELSQPVINRVSFYGVIHDINKEASAMAANDDSTLMNSADGNTATVINPSNGANPVPISEDIGSPLVEAVTGPSPSTINATTTAATIITKDTETTVQAALIDEERWLLSAIEWRGKDENRSIQACPPTFLQAMGEREYENPLTSLSVGSRTQLWKPSRSWWEAKSGKNPWVEPQIHNKRWRYLWPLIHYHKFLAKCIKKLKRNMVDVKQSVSPVAAFLREEVCAVSDHLAAVSLFGSDEWKDCLQHFNGWTDTSPETEARLRVLIGKLDLRPLAEHGDVESPLLRSQIDEQYLRAIAAQRMQMEPGLTDPVTGQSIANHKNSHGKQVNQHRRSGTAATRSVPSQVGVGNMMARGSGVRRPRYGYDQYPYPYWNQSGWHQAHYQHPYGDDSSVNTSLTTDLSEYGMPPGAHTPGHYYPPHMYQIHPHPAQDPRSNGALPAFDPSMHAGGVDPNMYPMHAPYPDYAGLGYYGHQTVDPNFAYAMPEPEVLVGGYYGIPQTPKATSRATPAAQQKGQDEDVTNEQAGSCMAEHHPPSNFDPNQTPSRSPYWGHLDATIAMGLSTPQTQIKETLKRASIVSPEDAGAESAQPLLLQQSQYGHYSYGPAVSNYGPPSPATQFMMSPQGNFMNYGYTGGYVHSPSQGQQQAGSSHIKQTSPNKTKDSLSSLKRVPPGLFPSVATKTNDKRTPKRDNHRSPSTVETITESETLSDAV